MYFPGIFTQLSNAPVVNLKYTGAESSRSGEWKLKVNNGLHSILTVFLICKHSLNILN